MNKIRYLSLFGIVWQILWMRVDFYGALIAFFVFLIIFLFTFKKYTKSKNNEGVENDG